MNVKQLLQTLIARQRLFLSVVAGIVFVVLVGSLLWPKTYIAQASVVVDTRSTDTVSGTLQIPEPLPSRLATQVDVIMSHTTALKVVRKLGLTSLPFYKDRYERATHGAGAIDDWVADYVLDHVTASPSHDSQVINIQAASREPELAARIANAFTDAYIQTSVDLKADPARRQADWFGEQVKGLRQQLQTALAALSSYQQSANVTGTNEQMDIENTRLSELSTELLTAQATMFADQSKYRRMEQAIQSDRLDETPEFANNLLLQNLRADLDRAQAQLAQTAERFGNHHPEYISAEAQVKALQRKLASELGTAAGAVKESADISARQVAQLQQALDQQRDRVLKLKQERDHSDILRRDVDSAQQAYDSALQRANQFHLESRLDQSGIAVLNQAIPPNFPARPKITLNVLLALVVGIILGVATVMAAEGMDQRIRSGEGFLELTGVTLLAEIPGLFPRRRGALIGGGPRMLGFKPREVT